MIEAKNHTYCAIYIRADSRASVTALVAAVLRASVDERFTVEADGVVFDVLRNPDAGLAADFVGWPFKIEAEAEGDAGAARFREAVSQVLTAAWSRGHDAVAACDFEDELPDLGGLRRCH